MVDAAIENSCTAINSESTRENRHNSTGTTIITYIASFITVTSYSMVDYAGIRTPTIFLPFIYLN